ncbi:hypothetical protein Rsub_03546 [Raphidocelis subcapitata]|uniref:Uncharacterized protein n=1 Tax=Raphidocelis subcapitata TaxID=307507 RepID=A0A2V0NUC4_9CHLO|nr:hypothetical protein Rsub_03546 [Raphidocelis subcapitata]|eukprot:GBF91226.1 hypothetical protein Rsub_03546 [Raphidocelis subcapitata]
MLGWPASEEPDFVLQRAAQYIESVIFHWRKLIAKAEAPPKKKKAGDPLPPRIVRVDAFVAERFGGWQEVVLRALASAFDAASGSFPPTAFDSVGAAVKAAAEEGVDPSLEGMNDKQLKALTMPFAKFRMEDALKGGLAVLDVKLPFDEAALLRANEAYLLRALGLEAVGVHSARDAAAAAAAGVDLAAAYPGAPAVALTAGGAPRGSGGGGGGGGSGGGAAAAGAKAAAPALAAV